MRHVRDWDGALLPVLRVLVAHRRSPATQSATAYKLGVNHARATARDTRGTRNTQSQRDSCRPPPSLPGIVPQLVVTVYAALNVSKCNSSLAIHVVILVIMSVRHGSERRERGVSPEGVWHRGFVLLVLYLYINERREKAGKARWASAGSTTGVKSVRGSKGRAQSLTSGKKKPKSPSSAPLPPPLSSSVAVPPLCRCVEHIPVCRVLWFLSQ